MKILFITHVNNNNKIINDYFNDSLLHGFREIYGENVIDYPGTWYMYQDEIKKRNFDLSNLWGNGFTFYDQLDNYNQVNRNNIAEKIKSNFFEYIIYGSFTRSKIYFDEAQKSKSKIILIDGEDNQNLNNNTKSNIIYFKRELNQNIKNVFPLNLSIPENKIVKKYNSSPNYLLAPLIPHRYNTYIYKTEKDYYDMWKDSLFGISYVHGGWWEALRYYEMLMNGCIPIILNIEKCPDQTLIFLPKKQLIEISNNYSWILNQFNPFKIYKKKFLDSGKIFNFLKYTFKKKYDSKQFIEKYPELNDYRSKLIDHTRKYLSTKSIAKYIIETADKFYNLND